MLKSVTPNLIVDDVQKSVDYYVNILGFKLENSVPAEQGLVWAQVTSGNVSVMLQERSSLDNALPVLQGFPIGMSGVLFIIMDNIHEFFNRIKDQVNVVKPMERAFYNHDEFTIADPDGYLLTFSEPME